ncbi:MAG TPA: efflux transporter outer membrane subunit [Opitutus sp.]|nr:efflux transporter outer membrane subunit [Opitutus sp.]
MKTPPVSPSPFRFTHVALALAVLAFTAGCTVGPDYHAPAATAVKMKTWAAAPAVTDNAAASDAWWTNFNDPLLGRLVERALSASPDIALAEQRIREARAGVRLAGGRAYPQIGASAAKMEFRRTGPLNTVFPGSYPTFQTGFDASWEIDLWGGTRRAVESAGAALQATQEAARGVRVALAAEVGRAYVELRATQRRLAIARTNLALQQRTLALTHERLHAGVASRLDALRAEALVANTEALVPQLEDGVVRETHLLAVLIGEEPDALAGELAAPEPIPTAPAQVALGLPAELLRRRPDIRAAERRLAAATARIGATKAQLYPHLGLSGTIGFVSTRSADLFDYSNRYFSLGPGLHWNLFDAGRVRAQVDAAAARAEGAYAAYRKTVLGALADVENALGAYQAEERRQHALAAAAGAARGAVATATELYRQGVTDFLSVLDAERSLAAAEDAIAQSDRAVSTDLIALYKSLGGGWRATGEASAALPAT